MIPWFAFSFLILFQADFFMTYILTNGLSGFSLEILQPGLLVWDAMKTHTWDRGKKKRPYLYSLPYYRIIPFVALCILIGMVYAVVSPLLLPFLVAYFCLGYVVFINQVNSLSSSIKYIFRALWYTVGYQIPIVSLIIALVNWDSVLWSHKQKRRWSNSMQCNYNMTSCPWVFFSFVSCLWHIIMHLEIHQWLLEFTSCLSVVLYFIN